MEMGVGIRDSGFGVRSSGFGIRDFGFRIWLEPLSKSRSFNPFMMLPPHSTAAGEAHRLHILFSGTHERLPYSS